MIAGVVRGLFIAPEAKASLAAVSEVRAVRGRGLEGDRYYHGRGSFSRWPGSGRAVSLIAREDLEAVHRERGIDLGGGRSRRNIETEGIVLTELIGRTFRIGSALLRGERECLPCQFLERLTEAGVYEALKHRGGLRAAVVAEGILHLGAAIEVVEMRSGG